MKNYGISEQVAQLIEHHCEIEIEDLSRIDNLIEQEIVESNCRQARENYYSNTNGGSR